MFKVMSDALIKVQAHRESVHMQERLMMLHTDLSIPVLYQINCNN